MKILYSFIFFISYTVSLSFMQEMKWCPYNFNASNITLTFTDGDIYCWYNSTLQWNLIMINKPIFDNGYLRINAKTIQQTDKLYVLEGRGIILFEEFVFPWDSSTNSISSTSIHDSPLICQSVSLDEWHARKYNMTEEHITHEGWNRVTLYEDGVSHVTASSSLTESNSDGSRTSYDANNVNDTLFFITGDGEVSLYYDNLTPPWVEGVEGYGIGEYLDIEFKYAADEVQVLNGFVDFRRMHLYMDNSRVKRVRIESSAPVFMKEYELQDIVRYNLIQLPAKTRHIRMTILDVYPGRKWQDTAISSILVTDPDQPPYEEQKEKLIALMKANGVWDKIEQFKREMNGSDGKR